MYKSDLPIKIGTELFPQVIFQPGAVQISIVLSRPQEGNARRAYESLSATIISHYAGELNTFFVAQRNNARNGIVRQHFTKKDFNQHLSAIYLYSFGMEWLRIIVRPEKYKTGGVFLWVLYGGNKVALLDYSRGGFAVVYSNTLSDSSWGTDKLPTNQLRFVKDSDTWVFWPIACDDNTLSVSSVYNCTQMTETGLKNSVPTSTPFPEYDSGAGMIKAYPIMNGSDTHLYTGTTNIIVESTGKLKSSGDTGEGVFAITADGSKYARRQYSSLASTPAMVFNELTSPDKLGEDRFSISGRVFMYMKDENPIYASMGLDEGSSVTFHYKYQDMDFDHGRNTLEARDDDPFTVVHVQWNGDTLDYAGMHWPIPTSSAVEEEYLMNIYHYWFPLAVEGKKYWAYDSTEFIWDASIARYRSDTRSLVTPYRTFTDTWQNVADGSLDFIGWLNVSDGNNLIQAFGVGSDNTTYYVYMNGENIGSKLAAIPELGMSVDNIQTILFDVSLEFVMNLK